MKSGTTDEARNIVTERLLSLYRRYLGEPEQLSDVYIGFSFFFGGVALATVGVVVFLWSNTLPARPGFYYQLREIAISLAMLGLPSFLLGIVVLLPTDQRALVGGGIGGVVCLAAVGLFVANYPRNWNIDGPDASGLGVTVYAVGVVLATAAVGAALVSNYIQRVEPSPSQVDSDEEEQDSTISDEQIQADIDDAMADAELSWGGVEKDDTKQLNIRTGDEEYDRSGLDNVNANERRASGGNVDNAVDGLQQLRGASPDEETGGGTDEQANALRELQERQAKEQAETKNQSILSRLRELFNL